MMPTRVEHLIIFFFFFFFFFLCFHVVFPAATAATSTSGGLEISLELIHREYSERSPYYTAGLSDDERHERLVKLSRARLQWLKSSSSSMGNASLNSIRPPMYQSHTAYLVAMKVGSGAGLKEYMLDFDTGSALTWIQCEPCIHCYEQDAPIFVPWNSPSYRRAPCSDPLCRRPRYECHNDVCRYEEKYHDGSNTKGNLSRETFGFLDVSGRRIQSVPNLAFGCSNSNEMHNEDKLVNGILGMNSDTESFAVQLAGITNGIFSYCLPPMTATVGSRPRRSGYLHFGRDISSMPGLQMTRLVPQGNPQYYVTLLDVSVAGQRLNLGRTIFGRHGMLVDTGASVTILALPAYLRAKEALKAYFEEHGAGTVIDTDRDVCFLGVRGMEDLLPSFTFHFDGANLEVPGALMFHVYTDHNVYCWKMTSSRDISIMGAAQMVNKRFGFDLRRRVILFAPETCA